MFYQTELKETALNDKVPEEIRDSFQDLLQAMLSKYQDLTSDIGHLGVNLDICVLDNTGNYIVPGYSMSLNADTEQYLSYVKTELN